jgi:hypothetical protein
MQPARFVSLQIHYTYTAILTPMMSVRPPHRIEKYSELAGSKTSHAELDTALSPDFLKAFLTLPHTPSGSLYCLDASSTSAKTSRQVCKSLLGSDLFLRPLLSASSYSCIACFRRCDSFSASWYSSSLYDPLNKHHTMSSHSSVTYSGRSASSSASSVTFDEIPEAVNVTGALKAETALGLPLFVRANSWSGS